MLIRPTYQQMWIDVLIRGRSASLPKDLDLFVNVWPGTLPERMSLAVQRCDRAEFEREVRALEGAVTGLEGYRRTASDDLKTINASYVERLNIVRELLDVQGTVANAWDAGWFIDDGRDLWNGIANPPAPPRSIVFEGRTILRLAPTPDEISMAIGARWKMFFAWIGSLWDVVNVGWDLAEAKQAIPYMASVLAVSKLKLLYVEGVLPYLDDAIAKARSLQWETEKYGDYFLSEGRCAKSVSVATKRIDESRAANGTWGFEWQLAYGDSATLPPGVRVRVSRVVEYDIESIGNTPNRFLRVETFRTDGDGKIGLQWQKGDPRQNNVTFSIDSILEPGQFYGDSGDSLSVQINRSEWTGVWEGSLNWERTGGPGAVVACLLQEGSRVTGDYLWGSAPETFQGRLEGGVRGNTLIFRYSDHDCKDSGRFFVTPDGSTIEGLYRCGSGLGVWNMVVNPVKTRDFAYGGRSPCR